MTTSNSLPIVKSDPEQHMVWGWANVATKDGMPVIDRQGDVVDIEELRKAAHDFMKNHRVSGDMHSVMGVGTVVESIVLDNDLQKALGINLGQEGWFIGVKVTNEKVWKRIKSGELSAFSIGGGGRREELSAAHKVLMGLVKGITKAVSRGNPNHDPKDGEFTSGSGGAASAALATANAGRKRKPKATASDAAYDPTTIHGVANHEAANQRALKLPKIADPTVHAESGVLAELTQSDGSVVKTGVPFTARYYHSNTKAPNLGTEYAQHIEPKGTYLYPAPSDAAMGAIKFAAIKRAVTGEDLEVGVVHMNNPIVLEYYNTSSTGWKKNLSDMYGGAVGRDLSDKIIQSGHDGIVTVDQGDLGMESINLTGQRTDIVSLTPFMPKVKGKPTDAEISRMLEFVNKFNPLHSPSTGQFTSGHSASAVSTAPPAMQHGGFSIDYTGAKSQYDTPNTMMARVMNDATPSTNTINTPERRALRRDIEKKMYGSGASKKDKRIDIVLGLPGAGKSTAIAKKLVARYGSLQIDSDDAKRALPEYEDPHYNIPGHVGTVSGAIHAESSDMANRVFEHAIRNHDNIVLPMIGKNMDSLNAKIDMLGKLGYETHVHLISAPTSVTIPRTIKRWEQSHQGYVDPAYQEQLTTKPLENFDKIRHDPRLAETTLINSDVPYGTEPAIVDHWLNPNRPVKKSGKHGLLGNLIGSDIGQADRRARKWLRKFGRSYVGYAEYKRLAKFDIAAEARNSDGEWTVGNTTPVKGAPSGLRIPALDSRGGWYDLASRYNGVVVNAKPDGSKLVLTPRNGMLSVGSDGFVYTDPTAPAVPEYNGSAKPPANFKIPALDVDTGWYDFAERYGGVVDTVKPDGSKLVNANGGLYYIGSDGFVYDDPEHPLDLQPRRQPIFLRDIEKFNRYHDDKGRFTSNGAAADKPQAFIPQEAQSSGNTGFVPESAHASDDDTRKLNSDIETALTDSATNRDAVAEAMQKFYGAPVTVIGKKETAGTFKGKISPNTSILVRHDATADQLDTMASLRGLVTGQDAQVWTRRLKANTPVSDNESTGYVVHGGVQNAMTPLTLKQYQGLQTIIKSSPEFAPLDGSTFKDGSFLFRNFNEDVSESKYSALLTKATQRLQDEESTRLHIGTGRYEGNYIAASDYISHVGQHPDALRWAADYLSTKTGPAYAKHAQEIGADVGAAQARIAARVTEIRAAADRLDSADHPVTKYNPYHDKHGKFSAAIGTTMSRNAEVKAIRSGLPKDHRAAARIMTWTAEQYDKDGNHLLASDYRRLAAVHAARGGLKILAKPKSHPAAVRALKTALSPLRDFLATPA